MANYRKSFNLRNGVQVDDDNFIVNANGLVGIGTSVPTEFLDVRGNAKVVGLVTATSVTAANLVVSGVTTFTTLSNGRITINSGIITAASGVVTYYGDGQGLINIPTSQWVDVNLGFGFTSIYNPGTVGIATTSPNYYLQIGGDPESSNGTGISSIGNIRASGIITASSFVGSGIQINQINASNISSGTLSNSRLPSNISISGIVTASSGFIGNVTGNTIGTHTGDVVGIASTARGLTGTPNITVATIIATALNSGFTTTGIGTVTNTFHVGTGGTAFSALGSGRIGVGTALPTSEFQIRKASGSLLEVISDAGSTRISIGQSVGVGKSTAVLRFGNVNNTLDIINNDTGNINHYLHAGVSGVGTGRFEWIYGQTNAQLMSLTYGGKLGLGKTNPDETLHVVGTSTVTSDAWFGNNVTITGTLSVGTLNIQSITGSLVGNVYASSGISTFSTINTVNIGIGTTNPIQAIDAQNSTALLSAIGIGTTNVASAKLRVDGGMAQFSSIGVGTTALYNVTGGNTGSVQIHGTTLSIFNGNLLVDNTNNNSIGFGTFIPRSILDFGQVGAAASIGFMILPTVDSSQRAGFASTVEGAIIYNSTIKKHQGYGSTNGGATYGWQDLY